ncbi:MAG: hypothetical protein EWM73_03177 [Nitrospira sp.]|nr:MAG: hypothetical protein EWM73_03177 [Nitrospira sp.]
MCGDKTGLRFLRSMDLFFLRRGEISLRRVFRSRSVSHEFRIIRLVDNRFRVIDNKW